MSQEHPDARDADDAAADRAGAHQIIGDIARMIIYRARVGVREDDRRAGKVDGFPRGAVARMRAADHHPDLVHDRNGPAAEIGEAARILVETSTRSEEHTSELQSLMRLTYAVLCLTKKKTL